MQKILVIPSIDIKEGKIKRAVEQRQQDLEFNQAILKYVIYLENIYYYLSRKLFQ